MADKDDNTIKNMSIDNNYALALLESIKGHSSLLM